MSQRQADRLRLDEQLAALADTAERLKWLTRHRLLGVSQLLVERGLMSADLGLLAERLAHRQAWVPAAQEAEEARVVQALSAAGCPSLVLKGCLLAHTVYPRSNQRWRGDLDVLVDQAALARARAELERLGYRPLWRVSGGTPSHQETWVIDRSSSRRSVDLHWRLRNHPALCDRLGFDEQYARAINVPGLPPGTLGQHPLHALLNAVMHWYDQLTPAARPAVWLLDIDLLWRKFDQAGVAELLDLAAKRELAGLLADLLGQARRVLATPVSADCLADLARSGAGQRPTRLIRAGRSRWSAFAFALRCQPGWRPGLAWLRQTLLPSRAYLVERDPGGARIGWARLQWRRWRGRH